MEVIDKLSIIQQQIAEVCHKVNRDPAEIKIIGVTKYVSNDRTIEAFNAGITHLGENREEGLLAKWDLLKDKPTWHFIGSLQTRKVKNILDKVSFIHSLDRQSLAKEINKRAAGPVSCFVQVNTSNEESKHGLPPHSAIEFVKELAKYPYIQVVGLMTMAPFTDNQGEIRDCFRALKDIQMEIKKLDLKHAPCTELSMGMSNDFEIAIEEGATYIRVGTALVGE